MNKILRYSFLALLAMMFAPSFAEDKTDELTWEGLGLDGKNASYAPFTDKTFNSSAVYAGVASSGSGKYIQLRSNKSDAGIVTTASGGKLKSVTITFNSGTTDRAIDIYGKNESYSEGPDMYNADKKGELIGSIAANGESMTVTPTKDFKYVGMVAHNGAIYIDKITVVWEDAGQGGDTKTATTINLSEGYETKVSSGLTGEVSLPTATVKAGENIVGEATWSLTIQRWSDTEDQPIIKNNKQVEIPNGTFGVVTLKAEYAGNETYKSSSKSYTLTVYRAETTIGLIYENIIKHMNRYDNGNATELSYWPVNLDEHGKVTIREEKVTYIDGKNVYITDGSQGMLLYFANTSEVTNLGLKVGSKIKLDESKIVDGHPVGLTNADGILGKVKFYNGMPELALDNGGFGSNVKIADGDAPSPKEITIDNIKVLIGILSTLNGNEGKPTPDLENNFAANVFINNYVTIQNAEYVGPVESTSNHKFKLEGQEFTVNKYKASLSDALVSGAKYTLTGFGTLYKQNKNFSEGELDPQLKLTIDPVKTSEPTGINTIKTDADVNAPVYNLAGQKVESSYKGLVIKNGKKVMQK